LGEGAGLKAFVTCAPLGEAAGWGRYRTSGIAVKRDTLLRSMGRGGYAQLDETLPEHFRQWVKLGIVIAGVGYLASGCLFGIWPWLTRDFYIGLFCLSTLWLQRRSPRAAAFVVLLVVWAELMASSLWGGFGVRGSNTLVMPVWVMAVALFLGNRAAWGLTLTTLCVFPICLWASGAFLGGRGVQPEDWNYFGVCLLSTLAATALITAFLSTLQKSLRRERVNAERTAQLVEGSPDAILALVGGKVVAFNELAEDYFSLSRDAVLGRDFQELNLLGEGAMSLKIEGRTDENPVEILVGGSTMEMRVRHLESGEDQSEQLLVFRDISDRRRAEERARELQNQLAHSQRLEAIGQLAGGVAHDFNNLLTAFSGTASLLEVSSDTSMRSLSGNLLAAADRGAALTRQLLTFARRDLVQETTVDVKETVLGAEALLSNVLGEPIRLTLELQEGCLIRADKAQLEQIVLNFAANARDATSGAGEFYLSCEKVGGKVALRARDTGAGMDVETREKIFEPFFTTKARNKGTGLGLSTVHGMVTQWGGRIDVSSRVGKGTTFCVLWPLTDITESEVAKRRGSIATQGFSGTVLLVEDDVAARDVVTRILKSNGLRVKALPSGEAALDYLAEEPLPDLLLTDVVMGGMSGVELAKRVRVNAPSLPVLFVSGYADEVLEGWPFNRTRDLLLKPFTSEVLIERIARKLSEGPAAQKARPTSR